MSNRQRALRIAAIIALVIGAYVASPAPAECQLGHCPRGNACLFDNQCEPFRCNLSCISIDKWGQDKRCY